ncbi:ABC transporter ATP-binding protein [Paenibacillus lupini]|uniref:ATP-binding cassette domain-containing protein n=1 Tax=Paenibacillus lupini TaxID=1450204 RepID=UPI0014245BB0|nr:ABC transporter ATP-binding protein [Paenibacillus lupini]NIK24541.1 ABC-2 type transport system ATP-binding protein [Paenibacillus lupini]
MLELKYVEKSFGQSRPILHVRDLRIPSGEIVGVLGENGSGKTTLLKAIMGLGEVKYRDIAINGRPVQEQYDQLAFITEEGSYIPKLTPLQYADFLAAFYPRFDLVYYNKLLKFYELEPNKRIRTFSRGQKSKLEISAGMAKGAKYILMDEPFLGKDMFTRRDFLKLMIGNLKGDETILIVTHHLDEIETVIDRALIMSRGRIEADFYMDDLREQGKDLTAIMAEKAGYKPDRYKTVLE